MKQPVNVYTSNRWLLVGLFVLRPWNVDVMSRFCTVAIHVSNLPKIDYTLTPMWCYIMINICVLIETPLENINTKWSLLHTPPLPGLISVSTCYSPVYASWWASLTPRTSGPSGRWRAGSMSPGPWACPARRWSCTSPCSCSRRNSSAATETTTRMEMS